MLERLVEMTDYGKHAWEVFPTILGKLLAGDRGLPHYHKHYY